MTLRLRGFRRFIRIVRSERGAALVELAVVLPLLIIIAVGVAEYGRLYFTAITVSNAARAGAQFGTQETQNSNIAGMTQAVLDEARDVAGVSATPPPTFFCRCPDGTSPSCSTGSCPGYGAVQVYVQASAQKTVTFLMKYPGMPASITVQRTATFRAQ